MNTENKICPFCRQALSKVVTTDNKTRIYVLDVVAVNERSEYYRLPDRGAFVTAYICNNCGNIQLFAAKSTGEIEPS